MVLLMKLFVWFLYLPLRLQYHSTFITSFFCIMSIKLWIFFNRPKSMQLKHYHYVRVVTPLLAKSKVLPTWTICTIFCHVSFFPVKIIYPLMCHFLSYVFWNDYMVLLLLVVEGKYSQISLLWKHGINFACRTPVLTDPYSLTTMVYFTEQLWRCHQWL